MNISQRPSRLPRKVLATSLFILLGAASTSALAADAYPLRMSGWTNGYQDLQLQAPAGTFNSASATSFNAYVGEFSGKVSGLSGYSNVAQDGSFLTYCLDLAQYFSFNTDYRYDSVVSASNRFGAVKADNLGRFYTAYAGQVNNTEKSVAFQLGLWEIITENTGNSLNLGSGDFRALPFGGNSALDNAAIGTANTWLAALPQTATSQYNISVLYDAQRQDFLLATPVPEPETWGMLLAGLGLCAAVARRRKIVA